MSECAYRLGLAFGREAERAEETSRKLEYFRLFDRCFFAVRVATALELRLWRAPAEALAARDADLRDDAEPSEGEQPQDREEDDREEGDRDRAPDERDRDREREAEPASLPVLLRTLDGVAADATAMPGPEPAALPTLRELLAHVAPEAAPAPRPTPLKTDLRARLAGSATAIALQTSPRLASSAPGLAVRRATGPPRR